MRMQIFTYADHKIVYLDGEEVISNDYSVENLYRVAEHLGWIVETIKLSDEEFQDGILPEIYQTQQTATVC